MKWIRSYCEFVHVLRFHSKRFRQICGCIRCISPCCLCDVCPCPCRRSFKGLGSWSVGVALETDPTVRRCRLSPNVSATSLLRVQDVFAVWRHMFWTFSLKFVQFFCISLSRSYQLKHLQILSYLPNSCNQLTWVSQWESWQSSGRFTRNHVGFENLRPGDAAGLAQGSVACGLRATIPEVWISGIWIFWRFLDVFEFVWLWILSLETERVEWFKYLIPIHCRTGRCQWIDHLLGRFGCHCLRVEFFEFRKRAFLGTSHLAENQVYLKLENAFGQWDEAPDKETEQMSEMMCLRMFMRPSRWALLCPAFGLSRDARAYTPSDSQPAEFLMCSTSVS